MTESWRNLRRSQQVPDLLKEGKYRVFLHVSTYGEESNTTLPPGFLGDFFERAGFTNISSHFVDFSKVFPSGTESCSLLVVFLESQKVYFSQRKQLELLASCVTTMVLLAEPLVLTEIPPSSCLFAILTPVEFPKKDHADSSVKFEKIILESIAKAAEATNGCVSADDLRFSSNGHIMLLGNSNNMVIRKTWGCFGPDVMFRCITSVHIERGVFVDGSTVGGLLKMVLPKAFVQIIPERSLPILIFLISPSGKERAGGRMCNFPYEDCSLAYDPETGECWLEVTCSVDPGTVLDNVYSSIGKENILDTRLAYSFDILASTQTFLVMQSLAVQRRVPDEELGIAIECVSVWEFCSQRNRTDFIAKENTEQLDDNQKNNLVYCVGANQLRTLVMETVRQEMERTIASQLSPQPVSDTSEFPIHSNGKGDKVMVPTHSLNRNLTCDHSFYASIGSTPVKEEHLTEDTMRRFARFEIESILKNEPIWKYIGHAKELDNIRVRLNETEAKLRSLEISCTKLPLPTEKEINTPSIATLYTDLVKLSSRLSSIEEEKICQIDNVRYDSVKKKLNAFQVELLELREGSVKVRTDIGSITTQVFRRMEAIEQEQKQRSEQQIQYTNSLETITALEAIVKSLEEKVQILGSQTLSSNYESSESKKSGTREEKYNKEFESVFSQVQNVLEEVLQVLQQHTEDRVAETRKDLDERLNGFSVMIHEKLEDMKFLVQGKERLF